MTKLSEDVLELSTAFKDAVERFLSEDKNRQLMAQEAATVKDLALLLYYAGRLDDTDETDRNNIISYNLRSFDKLAEICTKAFGQEQMAEFIPTKLKTEDAMAALQENKANNLAALCAYKA